jgi:hypothetical protein
MIILPVYRFPCTIPGTNTLDGRSVLDAAAAGRVATADASAATAAGFTAPLNGGNSSMGAEGGGDGAENGAIDP